MSAHVQRPLIGVTACLKERDGALYHSVYRPYVDAIVTAVDGIPVIVPALGEAQDMAGLLARLDGLLLTGSPSNVDPALYGGPPPRPDNEADPVRDATTMPLIRAAIEQAVPLLAICRGLQELNVALGGTLHQHVHELPGRADHRSDKTVPREQRYALRHPVALTDGGLMARLLGSGEAAMVNSLHGQGVDRPASALRVEATAPDGTIEALGHPAAPGFVLGVQWHPEYAPQDDPTSRRLFQAFGDAARARAQSRVSHDGLQRVA